MGAKISSPRPDAVPALRSGWRAGSLALLLLPALLLGCKQEIVPEPYQPTDAHDAYEHSLRQANLAETALGKDWISMAQAVLDAPIEVRPPFEEMFYVNPAAAFAVAYRFSALRGQRIELMVEVSAQQPGRLFIDLFRVPAEREQGWILVASANGDETRLEFESQRDNRYVVRLQPELLRGGQYKVTLRQVPSLAFPVSGRNSRAILSTFGQSRDGGRRRHHGIDIFAPRHTPVLSPCRAYVRNVGESDLGGRVIWLYDPRRRLHLYFAHLQSQDVRPNLWVETGQQIGTVGNTGNARSTHPHLHFGIYARGSGPVDPYHFVAETRTKPAAISADTLVLGSWMRSSVEPVALRSSWGSRPEPEQSLARHLPLLILAATGNMYRVQLPDGTSGYLPAKTLEPIDGVLQRQTAAIAREVKDTPASDGAAILLLTAGEEVSILGKFAEHWLVRTSRGSTGWIPIEEGH